jgi:peroxiredoxin Q/BCP
MAQLRQNYDGFVSADAEVLVVGPEGPAQFREYWQQNHLPYPGLPDPDHNVLKRYGQEINLFKLGRMPAQVVIDRLGKARFVHYGKSMSDIPESSEILALLARLNREYDSVAHTS